MDEMEEGLHVHTRERQAQRKVSRGVERKGWTEGSVKVAPEETLRLRFVVHDLPRLTRSVHILVLPLDVPLDPTEGGSAEPPHDRLAKGRMHSASSRPQISVHDA